MQTVGEKIELKANHCLKKFMDVVEMIANRRKLQRETIATMCSY